MELVKRQKPHTNGLIKHPPKPWGLTPLLAKYSLASITFRQHEAVAFYERQEGGKRGGRVRRCASAGRCAKDTRARALHTGKMRKRIYEHVVDYMNSGYYMHISQQLSCVCVCVCAYNLGKFSA